jgi:hypothetical protein
MSGTIIEGAQLVSRAEFRDADGVLGDPAAVAFVVKQPNADYARYDFGTDDEITTGGTGIYIASVNLLVQGTHYYEWWAIDAQGNVEVKEARAAKVFASKVTG